MYEDLKNTKIDKLNEKYSDFPEFLDGKVFIEYENGFMVKDDEIELSRQYLFSTDWYITRQVETGQEIPEEVKQLRAEARAKIK
jgi:hypothetical protein